MEIKMAQLKNSTAILLFINNNRKDRATAESRKEENGGVRENTIF